MIGTERERGSIAAEVGFVFPLRLLLAWGSDSSRVEGWPEGGSCYEMIPLQTNGKNSQQYSENSERTTAKLNGT